MDRGCVLAIDKKYAFIEMELNSSCKSCANKSVCFSGDKPIPYKIVNRYGLKKGDFVDIDITSKTKLSSGFLLFILPIIFLILGYSITSSFTENESYSIIGSVSGFIISLLLVKGINNLMTSKDQNILHPTSITIIETGTDLNDL